MKLLHCAECKDVLRLVARRRACRCGKAAGRYLGAKQAEVAGPAVVIGVDDEEFDGAVRRWAKEDAGQFRAWLLPAFASTVRRAAAVEPRPGTDEYRALAELRGQQRLEGGE